MPISPDRWSDVATIFDDSLALEPDERAAFVRQRASGDADLEREVASLLRALDEAGARYDRPAFASLSDLAENAPPARSRVGERIGAYEIVREVGHGGMGAIYEAVRADDQFRQRVAIKTIWRGGDSEVIVRRFRQERQILAGLNHANIASLLDGGMSEDGQPFFVMEFVEGRPIDVYCADARLSIRQRLALVRQVCAAVQYAHRNLVVHRDIKPSNILVTADGTVKLLDFGIAKLIPEDDSGSSTLTRAGLHPLTTAYASPEQVRGGQIATASDVYSLGVVLYEILTGRPPFSPAGTTPHELLRLICDVVPPRPSTSATDESATRVGLGTAQKLRRALEGELDDIVMMALRKEPERRYASVEQLSEDLRRYLEQLPVVARRDTLRYRTAKFVQRNRTLFLAGSALTVSLAAGIVGVLVQARAAARERDRARTAEAAADRQRAKAEQVSLFLSNMLGAADPSWYSSAERPGPQTTMASIIEAAGRRVDVELSGQPDVHAEILRTLGMSNRALFRLDVARQQLESAFALHQRINGPVSTEVAIDQYEIGSVFLHRGNYPEAERRMREALATFRAAGDTTSERYGRTINDLGLVLMGSGRPKDAAPLFETSAAHRRKLKSGESPELAIILGNQGLALSLQGKMEDAERAYREALALFARFPEREYFERGYTLHNLAFVMEAREQLPEAIRFAEEAHALWARLLGPEHPTAAVGLSSVARMAHRAGDDTRALRLARQAEVPLRRSLPPRHPDIARIDQILGMTLVSSGNVAEGERRLRNALDIRRETARGSIQMAEAEAELGVALLRQRRYVESESLLVSSYRSVDSSQVAGSPRPRLALRRLITLYESWGNPAQAARYRVLLGRPGPR